MEQVKSVLAMVNSEPDDAEKSITKEERNIQNYREISTTGRNLTSIFFVHILTLWAASAETWRSITSCPPGSQPGRNLEKETDNNLDVIN